MVEKSLTLLEQLPPEKNHIIDNWVNEGIVVDNSLKSQALLELSSQYCSFKNCLYCQIGNEILRKQNSRLT
jgi:hypothetical protein